MKLDQVGVNLWTVRKFYETAADFENSLKKIAEIGYAAIEMHADNLGLMPASDIKALCDSNGLRISSSFHKGVDILERPAEVAGVSKELGVPYAMYPWPDDVDLTDTAALFPFIDKLQNAYDVMKAEGITLCYHHHSLEFQKADGITALQHIMQRSSLLIEVDTYWVQLGGGDPVDIIERCCSRVPIIHLKDMVARKNEAAFAEVGMGNLNFKKIIAAGEAAGAQWFHVEQDETYERDPFHSLQISHDYIKANLVS